VYVHLLVLLYVLDAEHTAVVGVVDAADDEGDKKKKTKTTKKAAAAAATAMDVDSDSSTSYCTPNAHYTASVSCVDSLVALLAAHNRRSLDQLSARV
jgi:hypothetical protein